MYCVSIKNPDINTAIQSIQDYELAEIRLDLTHFGKEEIKRLCESKTDLIFTYRSNHHESDTDRLDLLLYAIDNGASWIDLDIDKDWDSIDKIKEKILAQNKTKLILSYHNFDRVPTNQEIYEILIRAGSQEPQLIKLACYSNGHRDNKRMVAINSSFSNVLAFNMGEMGRFTRILCLLAGAPFTYVCLKDEQTAPGQMDRDTMKEILDKYKSTTSNG